MRPLSFALGKPGPSTWYNTAENLASIVHSRTALAPTSCVKLANFPSGRRSYWTATRRPPHTSTTCPNNSYFRPVSTSSSPKPVPRLTRKGAVAPGIGQLAPVTPQKQPRLTKPRWEAIPESEWPWRPLPPRYHNIMEHERVVFARPDEGMNNPNLALYTCIFGGVIASFLLFGFTIEPLSEEAKERNHQSLFGSYFDEGMPWTMRAGFAMFFIVLPAGSLYVQSRYLTRLSLVRYKSAVDPSRPARYCLRASSGNNAMRFPLIKRRAYPLPKDLDPTKCSIRWRHEGPKKTFVSLRTTGTTFTQHYTMNYTPSERLNQLEDEDIDVVLSVKRLEAVFGTQGRRGSQYHDKGILRERLLEWWFNRDQGLKQAAESKE